MKIASISKRVSATNHIVRTTGDASVSEKYKHLGTQEVMSVFERNGFSYHRAWAQGRSAKSTKEQDTSKHVVEMRHQSVVAPQLGGLVPTVFIVNSHDGSSSLQIKVGMLRLVCMNGLVVGNEMGSFTIRHSGKAAQMSELEAKIAAIAQTFAAVVATFTKMNEYQMTDYQMKDLALEAMVIKYGYNTVVGISVEARIAAVNSLLRANRLQDEGNSLYLVFNRIQENMLNHSLSGKAVKVRSEVRKIELTVCLMNQVTRYLAA